MSEEREIKDTGEGTGQEPESKKASDSGNETVQAAEIQKSSAALEDSEEKKISQESLNSSKGSEKDADTDKSENTEPGPEWVSAMDTYPLREKVEDPKWAIRTVWIWIGFTIACIAGILLLLVLGAIYD